MRIFEEKDIFECLNSEEIPRGWRIRFIDSLCMACGANLVVYANKTIRINGSLWDRVNDIKRNHVVSKQFNTMD